jgi:isocitrate dehydrogenase (NAD+)
MEETGNPIPDEVFRSIRKNKVALKGPITTPIGEGFRSINVAIRKELGLYAGVRPARSFDGGPARYKDVDIVVIRENTEGLYSGVEHFVDEERSCAESIRIITRKGSERVIRFAFEYAKRHGRRKVTLVHKANILKATCGLFLKVGMEIAPSYEGIEFETRIVDNMAMQLVKKPEEYDVLVCPNLFGDILSDLVSGLVGGLGLTPGGNFGDDIAVFEPVHGSAPKYAGKDKVNPVAAILSGAMMLGYLGEVEAERRIFRAVQEVIKEGKYLTYDLGGSSGTAEMARAIIFRVRG